MVAATAAVVLLGVLGAACGVSIWEAKTIEASAQPIVHLASFNFTMGGSFAVKLQASVRPSSTYGASFVVCDADAWDRMQSLGFPDSTTALCMKRSSKSAATVLHSMCSVYYLVGSMFMTPEYLPASSNRTALPDMAWVASFGHEDRIRSTGMHHFLLDACSATCVSSTECLDDDPPSIRVTATLLFAMCDGTSPRHCSGTQMNHLVIIYTSFAVVWATAGAAWGVHTYRSRAPIFKFHVIMSLTLAMKVIATATTSVALLVTYLDTTLENLSVAFILQLGASCLTMLVVFGLADGCDIVGMHDRGFILAILYCGYSLVETAELWNPVLSAVMVACILFMITTLSTRRLHELHGLAYAMQQVGLNPDASPLGTKVRLLRATRMYSILFFLETYCIKIIFFLLDRPATAAEDAMVEGLQVCFYLVLGYTFRCRHFTYVLTLSRWPTPPPGPQQGTPLPRKPYSSRIPTTRDPSENSASARHAVK